MRELQLDMYLNEGEDYKTPARTCFLIDEIGTNSSGLAYLEIDGEPTGKIKDVVAPIHRTNTNVNDLLFLDKLFYVIAPETDFKVIGDTGSKFRICGKQLILRVGEKLSSDLEARIERQNDHYFTTKTNTYSHGKNVKLVNKQEVVILELTPDSHEKFTFNGFIGVSLANYSASESEIGVRFIRKETRLDKILEETPKGGIDMINMPRPPTITGEMRPFGLWWTPIVCEAKEKLQVIARNIKGTDISPATDTSLEFTTDVIYEYWRR